MRFWPHVPMALGAVMMWTAANTKLFDHPTEQAIFGAAFYISSFLMKSRS